MPNTIGMIHEILKWKDWQIINHERHEKHERIDLFRAFRDQKNIKWLSVHFRIQAII